MARTLTPRQEAFASHLVSGMTAAEAARQAGYSENYADRHAYALLEKPWVAARVAQLRAQIDRKAVADGQEVRETLTRILRQDLTEDTAVGGRNPQVLETRPASRDIIRAAETLAKLEGWLDRPADGAPGEWAAVAEALANPVEPEQAN